MMGLLRLGAAAVAAATAQLLNCETFFSKTRLEPYLLLLRRWLRGHQRLKPLSKATSFL
jgi:hypothetical protein